jgi:hypothetical protein
MCVMRSESGVCGVGLDARPAATNGIIGRLSPAYRPVGRQRLSRIRLKFGPIPDPEDDRTAPGPFDQPRPRFDARAPHSVPVPCEGSAPALFIRHIRHRDASTRFCQGMSLEHLPGLQASHSDRVWQEQRRPNLRRPQSVVERRFRKPETGSGAFGLERAKINGPMSGEPQVVRYCENGELAFFCRAPDRSQHFSPILSRTGRP